MCQILKKIKKGFLSRSDESKKGYPCPIPWINKDISVAGTILHFCILSLRQQGKGWDGGIIKDVAISRSD